jgi:isopenicillin N synthase-like dioxygenase
MIELKTWLLLVTLTIGFSCSGWHASLNVNSMDAVPIIDVGALLDGSDENAMLSVAKQLDDACRSVGFFYVRNHGIGVNVQRELVTSMRSFFALSESKKRELAMQKAGRAWRGYFGVGDELTSGKPDQKEGMYFGTELARDHPAVVANTPMHGANLFRDEAMRRAVVEYMRQATELGHKLLEGIALGLGLDRAYFAERFTRDPTLLFRVFNYPPLGDEQAAAGLYSVGTHSDYGFLTLLLQDDSGGLQVKTRRGEWIDAPPIDGTLVCNLGDMLELWTSGIYRATPHRVVYQPSSGGGDDVRPPASRLSCPVFFDPAWNCSLEPIDESLLRAEDTQLAKRIKASANTGVYARWDDLDLLAMPSSTYGAFLWKKVSKCFPELAESAQTPP